MKILLTTHQFFPHFRAGTEVLTRSVAQELMRRGHTVRILTGFPGKAALADEDRFDEYQVDGLHVHRFHHAHTPMGGQRSMIEVGYKNRLASRRFARLLKEFAPDLTHFFHLNRLGTGLIDEGAASGLPMFMTPTDFWAVCPTGQLSLGNGQMCPGPSRRAGNCVKHFALGNQGGLLGKMASALPQRGADFLVGMTQRGFIPVYPKRREVLAIASRLGNIVERLNLLKRLIVPTRFMGELLVQHGVAPERIVHAAYGIASDAKPLRQAAPSGRPLRIGFIGTLATHKGCHVLLEAVRALPEGAATVDIFGDPEELPDYVASLRELAAGCEGVSFRGTFPNTRIGAVLAEMDVLVVPSLWYENTPLVIYSAQGAGTPVVGSALPGIQSAVRDGVDGLVFPVGNAMALAAQLMRLHEDRGLLAELAANAPVPKPIEVYVDELMAAWSAA